MLKAKTFARKTRTGQVVQVAREHYLRDDIACGLAACRVCRRVAGAAARLRRGDVLVPDTNVILHQMDVLEHPAISNVVVLSTVLEEVKNRNVVAYKRLRALVDRPAKRFHVFVNEHCRETFIEARDGESPNDRNDRAIRVATAWYVKHTQTAMRDALDVAAVPPEDNGGTHEDGEEDEDGGGDLAAEFHVVLVTSDRENRRLALEAGLPATRLSDYVQTLSQHAELLDMLAAQNDDGEDDASRGGAGGADGGPGSSEDGNKAAEARTGASGALFAAHLNESAIARGIKSGELVQGVYRANRENPAEGTVAARGTGIRVLVQGPAMNRAIDGDIVVARMHEKSAWSAPADVVALNEGAEGVVPGEAAADFALPTTTGSAAVPSGAVVGIVRRNWRPYCGTILPPTDTRASRVLFVAQDRAIPPVRIQTRQLDKLLGMRIIVVIDGWPVDSKYPVGHFVRVIGPVGDREAETEVVLLEHDVPFEPFTPAVNSCLPTLPWIVTPADEAMRENLRNRHICSVDPPGCTDIDDALHAHRLPNGNYEVGVHIADVSHFVRPGTALDLEAAKRCTSVYLADRRIDMIPALLSSNLCSLQGGVDRFAMSCIWEMSPDTTIVSTRFCKSIICSDAAMMYSEAQIAIDDPKDNRPVAQGLRILMELAKILRQRRLDNGALLLASTETRFTIESETHDPVDVEPKTHYDTHFMVEEFMLLANISVARFIFEHFPTCAMLRNHPAPPASNFEPLVLAAAGAGFTLDTSSSLALAQTLETANSTEKPYANTLLRILATRCMLPAAYLSSGMDTEANFRHYGLASPIYTHFTSPIRRYADLVVHRLLAAAIGKDSTYPDLLDKDKVAQQAEILNFRHRNAQMASRASTSLHCQIFFKGKIKYETAYVLRVRKNALMVLIPQYGLEGPVYFDSPDLLTYDSKLPSLTVAGHTFRVFDLVTVQITVEESLQNRRILLKLVKPVIPGVSITPAQPLEEPASSAPAEEPREPSRKKAKKNTH